MASREDIEKIIVSFDSWSNRPEEFLYPQPEIAGQFIDSTKQLYDLSRNLGSAVEDGALPELITDNFDDEQIWQEIELQNDPCVKSVLGKISQLATSRNFDFALVDSSAADTDIIDDMEPEEEDGESTRDDEDNASDFASDHSEKKELSGEDNDDSDAEEQRLEAALDMIQNAPGHHSNSDEDEDDNEDDDDLEEDLEFDINAHKKTDGKSGGQKKSMGTNQKDIKKSSKPSHKRKTIVDDKFFKMADMEAFLEVEDAKEEKRQKMLTGGDAESSDDEDDAKEEAVDMFAADENDDSVDDMGYYDFFDPPDDEEHDNEGPGGKDVDESSDEDDGSDNSVDEEKNIAKTTDLFDHDSEGEDAETILGHTKAERASQFEKRQEKLKKKISEIEDNMIETKPWQLSGEVTAKSRPENSLLQEDVDFEHTTRVNPAITEETTVKLEDFIKQRVKDKAWDDVERKEKPKENPYEYKKRIVLDQEKSKLSLGEVYEKEYIKQATQEEAEEEDPEHENIRKMMQSLFVKLDALTNFHFTPKPAAPEVKIVSNLPSVVMEEVAPTSVSETAMLAPEEVHTKELRESKGATEKDSTDRKRERRDKKKSQGARQKAREQKAKLLEKVNPGLGNKFAKEKAMKDLEKQSKLSKVVTMIKDDKGRKSALSSSTKFFSQLQDEVTTQIKQKRAFKQKKKEKLTSSAKLKL